jgi:hypothetical protein
MLDIATLGLPAAPVAGNPPSDSREPLRKLVPGSATAKALNSVWSGNRLTIVDSPPGAGKTALVVETIGHLLQGTDMFIVVATPTKAQALSMAYRLAAEIDSGLIDFSVPSIPEADLPAGVGRGHKSGIRVTIRTLASCAMKPPSDGTDLLVVDEAYQATTSDVLSAVQNIDQLLLVGDPGQIGPVVSIDTSLWSRERLAPHSRSPEGMRRLADVSEFTIDQSWRLGQRTVDVIAPLYSFPFTSARPQRSLLDHDGGELPEVAQLIVDETSAPDGLDAMTTVADRVEHLCGLTLTGPATDESGAAVEVAWDVEPKDIAVVVARNVQASTLTSMLSSRGLGGVVVGTADRLQGGQWPVVVAVDPLLGGSTASPHALALGRLTVMLSRHTTHLDWISERRWPQQCVQIDGEEGAVHAEVRRRIAD